MSQTTNTCHPQLLECPDLLVQLVHLVLPVLLD